MKTVSMRDFTIAVTVIFIIGIFVGRQFTAPSYRDDASKMEDRMAMDSMDTKDMDHSMMNHEEIEVPADLPTPSVDLVVHNDPKSGWNLQLITSNFKFSPRNASTEHVDGEGHAHLYVDGIKIGRLYGEWYHFDEKLSPGDHEFQITLNANDHSDLVKNGNHIEDTEIVTVQ